MADQMTVRQIESGLKRTARTIAAGKDAEREMVELYLAGDGLKIKHATLADWASRKPAAVSKALSTARRRREA